MFTKITYRDGEFYTDPDPPRTQKALGVSKLVKEVHPHETVVCISPNGEIGQQDVPRLETILQQIFKDESRLFLRPCPVYPRHGFVDSRPFDGPETLRAVINETLKADPNGEVLVMRFHDAPLSAVWTPTSITIGEGTNGATAGKTLLSIPFPGAAIYSSAYTHGLVNVANHIITYLPTPASVGIGDEHVPYIEALYNKQSSHAILVQYRPGPAIKGNHMWFLGDYTPGKTITWIGLLDQDVNTWQKVETLMKEAQTYNSVSERARGFILPPGYSLTSHIGTMARVFNVPVCLYDASYKAPFITGSTETTYQVPDPVLVAKELKKAVKKPFIDPWQKDQGWRLYAVKEASSTKGREQLNVMASFSLIVAHHALTWPNDATTAKLIAVAVKDYIYLTLASMGGELRHSRRFVKGLTRRTKAPAYRRMEIRRIFTTGRLLNRTNRYNHITAYLGIPWNKVGKYLDSMIADFRDYRLWRSQYGGSAWADIGEGLRWVYNMVNKLISEPSSKKALTDLFVFWHQSITIQHNSHGTPLDRYVYKNTFEKADKRPWLLFHSTLMVYYWLLVTNRIPESMKGEFL